jgi:hypothetical protein
MRLNRKQAAAHAVSRLKKCDINAASVQRHRRTRTGQSRADNRDVTNNLIRRGGLARP